MLKHGQKIAPVDVDKNHKCGLYVNMPWTRSCTYCCFYCKQWKDCVNACKNTPEKCASEVYNK